MHIESCLNLLVWTVQLLTWGAYLGLRPGPAKMLAGVVGLWTLTLVAAALEAPCGLTAGAGASVLTLALLVQPLSAAE